MDQSKAVTAVGTNVSTKKRLKLSDPRAIRRALNRIANMCLNGEISEKQANTITYICNVILGSFKQIEFIDGGEVLSVETKAKVTIQQLLRAAEITDDEDRRNIYLDAADQILRTQLPRNVVLPQLDCGLRKE